MHDLFFSFSLPQEGRERERGEEREEARRAEEEEEMSGAGLGWTADYFCFVDTTLS